MMAIAESAVRVAGALRGHNYTKRDDKNMPDFSAAIALLRKPIEDLYVGSSGAVREKIAMVRTSAKMKSLHKKLWESQRVKTIWQTDRPLSLSSFFYPVAVSSNDGDVNGGTRLTSLDDLPNNHNIIFGTVGQGKSILARYLLGREIRSGTRIPVLCELRNIGEEGLLNHLCMRFSVLLGMKADLSLMSAFAENGKVSFILDGFDEIDSDNVQKVLLEIEDLSYKYQSCRIMLTSRPDTECKSLTRFYSNKICPLLVSDLNAFYKKITKDDEFTKRLVAAVETSPVKIRDLVKTPLLATLLAISYRTAHKIPLDFAEFYDELFQILLVRHDGSKLGWRRERKTKLNDREIQQIFEAFCFVTRRKQTPAPDRENAILLAAECLQECQASSDPQGFLDDVKRITCLLVDEGKKLNFVHASVQEFFSARYIKTRIQPIAERFYKQLVEGKWSKWTAEIQFLHQIDPHRITKYFLIPDVDETVIDFLNPPGAISQLATDRYLKSFLVTKERVTRDGKVSARYFIKNGRMINTYHYSLIDSKLFSTLFYLQTPTERKWTSGFDSDPSSAARTYLQIAQDKGDTCYSRMSELITIEINKLIRERIEMTNNVSHDEMPTSFMDI